MYSVFVHHDLQPATSQVQYQDLAGPISILAEVLRDLAVMSTYPYTWEDLSQEDEATVKRHYGSLGKCRNLVR